MANQNSFPSPQLETSRLFPSDTHDLVDNPVPKKRLKVSHPEVIDLTTPLPETSTSEEPVQASPVEANKQNHGVSKHFKAYWETAVIYLANRLLDPSNSALRLVVPEMCLPNPLLRGV